MLPNPPTQPDEATVRAIVKWLRERADQEDKYDTARANALWDAADAIERGEPFD